MAKVAGIDLGTTFSAIAILNEVGKAEIVPNRDGDRITPSAVSFDLDRERPMVGTEAKNRRSDEEHRLKTFVHFKRSMNEPDQVYTPHGRSSENYLRSFKGEEITPVFLSALVLKKLVDDASHHCGERIDDVVISVPAYFAQIQREGTMRAAKMAGLNVIDLVNEPTAAAIYYTTQREVSGKIMIFDLGGGTFDVTILSVAGSEVEILTSRGDSKLGGTDFDTRIADVVKTRYETERNGPLIDGDTNIELLEQDCENLKKRLSKVPQQKLPMSGASGRYACPFTDADLEQTIAAELSRIELLMEATLDEIGLKPSDISQTLLVGGSTRTPAIQTLVERVMGKPPETAPNVDEIVALGAAIRAGIHVNKVSPNKLTAAAQKAMNSFDVVDIANVSYGTLCLNDDGTRRVNDILIPKNTPLPCEVSKTYYTVSDGQESINCNVTQGESLYEDLVDLIHQEPLSLPPGRPRGQPIEVTYSYDASQIMHCRFRDSGTGTVHEVDLSPGAEGDDTDDLSDLLID